MTLFDLVFKVSLIFLKIMLQEAYASNVNSKIAASNLKERLDCYTYKPKAMRRKCSDGLDSIRCHTKRIVLQNEVQSTSRRTSNRRKSMPHDLRIKPMVHWRVTQMWGVGAGLVGLCYLRSVSTVYQEEEIIHKIRNVNIRGKDHHRSIANQQLEI